MNIIKKTVILIVIVLNPGVILASDIEWCKEDEARTKSCIESVRKYASEKDFPFACSVRDRALANLIERGEFSENISPLEREVRFLREAGYLFRMRMKCQEHKFVRQCERMSVELQACFGDMRKEGSGGGADLYVPCISNQAARNLLDQEVEFKDVSSAKITDIVRALVLNAESLRLTREYLACVDHGNLGFCEEDRNPSSWTDGYASDSEIEACREKNEVQEGLFYAREIYEGVTSILLEQLRQVNNNK